MSGRRLYREHSGSPVSHVRGYGWLRSPEDRRDKVANPAGLFIKDEVDPRKGVKMPGIYDQGNLGSCTSNAVGAALQFDRNLDLAPDHYRRPSRLDIYYGERMLEGSPANEDTGAYGRDAFKFASQTGYLMERAWPYDINTFAGPPPEGKTRHKLTKPYAVVPRDVDQIKAVLSNHQTMAFGFTVYDSFESMKVAVSGVVPMPGTGERIVGGHEVLAVGYLADHPDHVLCRNSWGTSWGMSGYFLMPWKYLMDSDLSDDFRTIVRAA